MYDFFLIFLNIVSNVLLWFEFNICIIEENVFFKIKRGNSFGNWK